MGLGFTINRITTEQFAVFPEHLDLNQEVQVADEFHFSLNPLNQQVEVYAAFNFKQQEFIVMKIVVICDFEIWDSTWNSFIQNNRVHLPRDFAINLLSITVGAARGMLSSKTENTPLSKYILPLLNVHDIITKEVIFTYK